MKKLLLVSILAIISCRAPTKCEIISNDYQIVYDNWSYHCKFGSYDKQFCANQKEVIDHFLILLKDCDKGEK